MKKLKTLYNSWLLKRSLKKLKSEIEASIKIYNDYNAKLYRLAAMIDRNGEDKTYFFRCGKFVMPLTSEYVDPVISYGHKSCSKRLGELNKMLENFETIKL